MARRDEDGLDQQPTAALPPLSMTPEQFAKLIEAVKTTGSTEHTDRLEQILLKTAEVSAQSMKTAMKPENDQHPGHSVFSYPEGDKAKPRPVIPHQFFWNNFPVHQFPESHHWLEL